MPRLREYSSCEFPRRAGKRKADKNRIYRFNNDFSWTGVRVDKYKLGGTDWENISRQELIGVSGENVKFHVRYFEIRSGGFSSYETHRHEHVLIGIRGKGIARFARRRVHVNYLDVLYIKPETPHRLLNPYREPFGFFCIVDAKRDRPKPVKRQRR